MKKLLIVLLSVLLAATYLFAQETGTKGLRPRKTLKIENVKLLDNHNYRILVKFKDELSVRLKPHNGLYTKTSGASTIQAKDGLDKLNQLVKTLKANISPVLAIAPEKLEAYKARSEKRSGNAKPDLAGMFYIDTENPGNIEQVDSIVKFINSLGVCEYVSVKDLDKKLIAPYDIPPVTPDHTPLQLYRGADPGMNVDYAWSKGAKGQNIRFTDIEWSWNLNHEDLMDSNIHVQNGQTININDGNIYHGTAMLGISAAGDNGYGITGIAPDAEFWVYPFPEQELYTALQHAIEDSNPGDIILIEVAHTDSPMETDLEIWQLIEAAKDDVIIIEPTGNIDNNLDKENYNAWRSWGDSGAIIVSGGTADKYHEHHAGCYGSRVDIQNWSYDIYSTSSGNASDTQSYAYWGGTSGASALTAGACTILQSAAEQKMGRRLTPAEMRQLLKRSGTQRGDSYPIGRFINLQGAVDSIINQPGGNFKYPPTVDCGTDINVNWPTNTVTLSPTVENDAGEQLSSQWLQIGGPAAVTFGNWLSPVTYVTFPQPGKYTLRLSCSYPLTHSSSGDPLEQSSSDDIVVYVNRVYSSGFISIDNRLPQFEPRRTNYRDLATNGTYAYILENRTLKDVLLDAEVNEKNLQIINITNPSEPLKVGQWNTDSDITDVEVAGHYAYIKDTQGQIHIIDVQDPAHPQETGLYDTYWPFGTSLQVRDNIAYFGLDNNGIQFIDVSNPANPQCMNRFFLQDKNFHFLRLAGDYLYFFNDVTSNEEFVIVNIADIMNPQLVGTLSLSGKKCLATEIGGNYAYLHIEGEGIKVVDISNKTNPVQVASYATNATGFIYNNNNLYLTCGREIQIVDVSVAANPILASIYAPTELRAENHRMTCEKLCPAEDGKKILIFGSFHFHYDDPNYCNALAVVNTHDRLDVTINQLVGQADPVNTGSINFAVTFSDNVSDFTASDVSISGTAGGAKTVTVNGLGANYLVTVSGMTTSGTVQASIPSGSAHDMFGNANWASKSTDNTVNWDTTSPFVSSITSPTSSTTGASLIPVTIVWNEAINPATFIPADILVTNGIVENGSLRTSDNITWTLNILPVGPGVVMVQLPIGICNDPAGNANNTSTVFSRTYINSVSWGGTTPAVNSSAATITTGNLNITANNNRILIVGISTKKSTYGAITVANVVLNSSTPTVLTAIPGATQTCTSGNNSFISTLWYVVNPPVTNSSITVTLSGAPSRAKVDAFWLYNVNTSSALGSVLATAKSGPATTISTTLAAAWNNSVIVDNIAGSDPSSVFNANSGQTVRWSSSDTLSIGAGSTKQLGAAGTATAGWTVSNQAAALLQSAVEIKIIQ